MQITKRFNIREVRATNASNAPIEIMLQTEPWRGEQKETALILDAKTCASHGIPRSLDIVGRTLICSFESREVPRRAKASGAGRESLQSSDLLPRVLSRIETVSFPHGGTLEKHEETTRTLELR